MPKSTDAALLALLATLEQRAKAKGEKSIVKGVVARLADVGADPALIAEIAALRKRKTDAETAAETKASTKASIKAPPKAAASGRTKAKPAAAKAAAGAEEPAVQG